MLPKHACILAAVFSALGLSPLTSATPDEDPIDKDLIEGGQQCLRTRIINKTEVIHDQAILFYLRGSAIYVNVLPKPCKSLSKAGRFRYDTLVARICRFDLITVLRDGDMGLSPGRACRIGGFYPITTEQLEALKEPDKLEPLPIPPAHPDDPRPTDQSETSNSSIEPEETE